MGFLAGFIGAAPFAWGLLSDQLASGAFVRGLWYFFAIVVAAGLFTGIAGLGVGYVVGVFWEQFHRSRRVKKLQQKAIEDARRPAAPPPPAFISHETPRLQLVSVDAPDLPVIDGRVLQSIQFQTTAISLDLGGIRLRVTGNPVTVCRGVRSRFPDPGSRDALCSLIGDRIHTVRTPTTERLELVFESGCELVIPRSTIAVA